MNSFTVEWRDEALDVLAEAWLNGKDRRAINDAEREIDQLLSQDPLGYGRALSEGLYQLHAPPLVAFFSVDESTRTVSVTELWYLP